MSNINATLATARRALLAQQAALAVTSDNIANVNTPGYARRRAELTQGPIIQDSGGGFGTGVDVTSVTIMRDAFIERQFLRTNADAARYGASQDQMAVVETAMGALGDTGLTASFGRFFSAWNDLASDPSSRGTKTIVQNAGREVADRFNSLGRSLDEQQLMVNEQIEDKLNRVNILLKQMAKLNQESLNKVEPGQIDDARMAVMDELSQLSGASFRQDEDGSLSVLIGGFIVAQKGEAREIKFEKLENGDIKLLPLVEGSIDLQLDSGEIVGLIETRDDQIAELRTRIDNLAVTFAREVNTIHSTGYNQHGSRAGTFFADNITGANDFRLAADIEADASNIAASANGQTGDNGIALSMAGLETAKVVDGSQTFSDAYGEIVSDFASQINEVRLMAQAATDSKSQMESWRESVSGVSLNEEMTKLIQFENAFNAAAKLTATISKMMDTILGIV